MTKRHSAHNHGWLKVGILLMSVAATLAGVQWLQWQETGAAETAANGMTKTVIVAAQPAAGQPAAAAAPSIDGLTLELPPVPTVSAAPVRAVARTRSSR